MKKFSVFLLGAVLLLSGCQTEIASINKETNQIEMEDVRDTIDRDEFSGYWQDEDYIFYLSDKVFYIQNKNNLYVNSFPYSNENLENAKLELSLGQLREKDSISLIEPNSKLILAMDDKHLSISDEALASRKFVQIEESNINENFHSFVKTDGKIGKLAYQGKDLTLEDFKGYYAPFDKYGINDGVQSELGTYTIHLGNEFLIFAIPQSEAFIDYFSDYEIEGNTLTIHSESVDTESLRMFEDGFSDSVVRKKASLSFTLFEEEDRNRLIDHSSGIVLQSVTEDEIETDNYGESYKENLEEHGRIQVDILDSLSEEEYFIDTIDSTNDSLNTHHYPYSIGELSEITLYEEQQIINGLKEHTESELNENQAVEELLKGSFENTPSYGTESYSDLGYIFNKNEDGASFTYGYGGRTYWSSTPFYGEITDITFEDHVYTIRYEDSSSLNAGTERFYRISETVIYREDSNGDFNERFAQNTRWEDFHGMPDHMPKTLENP